LLTARALIQENPPVIKNCNYQELVHVAVTDNVYHHTTTTVSWRFFQDRSGESVPEENFWTFTVKINRGRCTDHPAGHHSIRTPYQCPPPHSFTGRMPFLPPNQQHQSTEGN